MNNQIKPIAGLSLVGELGIEIIGVQYGSEDLVNYKFTDSDKVYEAVVYYNSEIGACFEHEENLYFLNEFIKY